MKHHVQIKYPNFAEIFEAKIDGDNIDIDLLEVLPKSKSSDDYVNFDLATSIRENYSNFPFESGDLTLIQSSNFFIIS